MTTATIFTAAHAAARLADQMVAYRTRFSTALKSAWAAAKQTIKTVMSNIIATIHLEDEHATPGTVPAKIYEVYHATETAAFVTLRIEGREAPAKQRIACIHKSLAGAAAAAFTLNGQAFYICSDATSWSDVTDRDAQRGFTQADATAALVALNA